MAGRPPKPFDNALFESCCRIQCTEGEICSVMHLDHKTLTKKVSEFYQTDYSQAYKMFAEEGKMSIRRTQLKLAETNASMAIWVGKQYLGQSDDPKRETQDAELMRALLEVIK